MMPPRVAQHTPVSMCRSAPGLGLSLLLAGCGGTAPAPSGSPAPAPPSAPWPGGAETVDKVLIVVVDTLRDDVARSASTPTMDALARTGTRVDRAWSAGSWTVPSVVSLLTGMPVRQHGWDEPAARMGKYPPLPAVPTVATVLQDAGFRCDGLYANPYLAEALGFSRGFDSWVRAGDAAIPAKLAALVQAHWTPTSRNLAYVHLLGPHSPLLPGEEARARHGLGGSAGDAWFAGRHGLTIGQAKRNTEPGVRAAYAQAYAAVVEETDARLAAVLAALGPHRDRTLVVLTSDHGELLGEHGIAGHGWWLWRELVEVPLIVDHPGIPGEQESLPPVLANGVVPALVTGAAGVAAPWPWDLTTATTLLAQREGRVAVSGDGQHKAIWDARILDPGPAVFDLATDPGEADPAAAAADRAALVSLWEALQARHPAGQQAPAAVGLDPATHDALKTLGYVAEDDAAAP